MADKERSRDDVRHRSRMMDKRSKSHAARNARSQPLPGQQGFGSTASKTARPERRLGSQQARGKNRQRRRLATETGPINFEVRPPPPRRSGYRRVDDGSAIVNVAMVEAVLSQRVAARKARDYASADRLRAVLATIGVEISDDEKTWRVSRGRPQPPQPRRKQPSSSARQRNLRYLELFFRGMILYGATRGGGSGR